MPTTASPLISEDLIDDILYSSRTGDLSTLRNDLDTLFISHPTSPLPTLIPSIIDPTSKNTILHMASANGHTSILSYILSSFAAAAAASSSPTIPAKMINAQNEAGNTPLHWAAVNGHLDAVKVLVDAGADTQVRNGAEHLAVHEADVNGKEEVVGWLLGREEGKGKGEGKDGEDRQEEQEVLGGKVGGAAGEREIEDGQGYGE